MHIVVNSDGWLYSLLFTCLHLSFIHSYPSSSILQSLTFPLQLTKIEMAHWWVPFCWNPLAAKYSFFHNSKTMEHKCWRCALWVVAHLCPVSSMTVRQCHINVKGCYSSWWRCCNILNLAIFKKPACVITSGTVISSNGNTHSFIIQGSQFIYGGGHSNDDFLISTHTI